MKTQKKAAGVSDDAVRAKTGKGWDEWFALLDRAGAAKMDHKQIVACLDKYPIGGWWQQMVTVAYEQERGLRAKHQQADGFATGVSRTVGVPVDTLYGAWHNARKRRRWL